MTHPARCPGNWHTPSGGQHTCVLPPEHDSACYCCGPDDGYPGGDLAVLEREPVG